MHSEQAPGTTSFLPLSAALAVLCLWPGNSGQAAGAESTVTLADMASDVQYQAARSVTPADQPEPLETVGAKGGVLGVVVSDHSEPGDSGSNDIVTGQAIHEAVAPESYLERLSRIVVDFQNDLQAAAQERRAGPGDVSDLAVSLEPAANEASVPDELIFRLHARSVAGSGQAQQLQAPEAPAPVVSSTESSLTWVLVGAAADAAGQSAADSVDRSFAEAMPPRRSETRLSDLVDAGGSLETPQGGSNSQQAVEPVPGGQVPRFQGSGLTLADMAMVPTPAPAKQAAGSDTRRTARRSLVFRLPGTRLGQFGPRAKRRQVLSFPDPRDFGVGRDDEVLQYPASASLARFLGGIESMPLPSRGLSRGSRSVMPVNLDQVARRVDRARAASAATESHSPYRSFSFSGESFAGNHLTTGSYGDRGSNGRRQALIYELREVFTPSPE